MEDIFSDNQIQELNQLRQQKIQKQKQRANQSRWEEISPAKEEKIDVSSRPPLRPTKKW